MTFLGNVGHDTRNILEHFRDLVVSPLNPGSIFIFHRSVSVSNIMENGGTDFH